MKNSKFIIQNLRFLFCVVYFAICFSAARAQSTRVEAPTPVTARAISGAIAARDIGDSRLTTYYYVFSGRQGDITLKIKSSNFNGDVDVFYAENLRPLTKISLFADASPTEIGREIYLRKPEKLILRVEGRTPNDDAATFSIEFEGSFEPLAAAIKANSEAEAPTLKTEVAGAVGVNSVGTIIEPAPATPAEAVAETTVKPIETVTTPESVSTADRDDKDAANSAESPNRVKPPAAKAPRKTRVPTRKVAAEKPKTPAPPVAEKPKTPPVKSAAARKAEELAKALESVRLVVLFKDGGKIERPMSEIQRFNVDRGVLTITTKDGSLSRHSILDVTKVAIE